MAAKKSGGLSLGGLNQTVVLVVVWVVAVIGVLAGYYFLLYDPLAQDREQQEARRTELAASRIREEQNLRRYNTDVAELARARVHAQSLESVLPNDPDIPGFMRSINALAEASGLAIRLIQPVDERIERYFARIPVQMQVNGTYLSLARFFHSVSQLPRVINMENIKLLTPSEDPNTHEMMLSATLLATTFRGVTTAPVAGAAGAPGAPAGGAR
jgi:type IV pilus assembly protein PilO